MQSEMNHAKTRQVRRKKSVRRRVKSHARVPHRIVVTRSLKHIAAQIVDDLQGRVLLGVSTQSKAAEGAKSKVDAAAQVGRVLAEGAKKQGIEIVVFDRSGYKYHGRVRALADGARAAGLKF